MSQKPLPYFKRGDRLKAADLMALRAQVQRQRLEAGQNSGIVLQENPHCTAIRVAFPSNRYLAVADANIAARSGTAPGTGTATIQNYDGTNLGSTGISVDVLNPSSTTMTSGNGIDSGMYCWIEQDPDGWWWIWPLECS